MTKAPGEKDSSSNAGILLKPAVHVLLIVVLGLLAYSNTFYAPFVFDDLNNMSRENYLLMVLLKELQINQWPSLQR